MKLALIIMSNSELREYLQQSRHKRSPLIEKAAEIIYPTLQSPLDNSPEFPYPNSQRFIHFKDSVNVSLQQIFRPGKNKPLNHPVLKSLTKGELYKKIYMPEIKSSKASRKPNSCTPGLSNYGSLFNKYNYKEVYLTPLFPKPPLRLTELHSYL